MAKLFLSYARVDQEAVEVYYDRLSAEGYTPWMDSRDLRPGEDWERAIIRELRSSDFVLVFLSFSSINKRGFLQKEIRYALAEWENMLTTDIYLIPLRIDKCPLPEPLRRFHCLDLFLRDSWPKLLSALQEGLSRRNGDGDAQTDGVRAPFPLPTARTSGILRGEVVLRRSDVSRILSQAASLWEAELKDKEIELVVRNDLDQDERLVGNSETLANTIFNLLGNAIKYSHTGRYVRIRVAKTLTGDLGVDITNYGPGVEKTEDAHVFRFHERGQRARDSDYRGMGLGLAISKRIVSRLGGQVAVSSREVKDGAHINSFRITFPLVTYRRL